MNLCPTKLFWELTQLPAFSGLPQPWWQHPALISDALETLSSVGIQGVKLNIFCSELTVDGKHYNFEPIDMMLELCKKSGLKVHLCVGPFQYPLWPGVRIPGELLVVKKMSEHLDDHKLWKEFGTEFVKKVVKRYARHTQIDGFYLGNEWHTKQAIEGFHPEHQWKLSPSYQLYLTKVVKKLTRKSIIFNTQFDASLMKSLQHSFNSLYKALKQQFILGFDVYPSRETFRLDPRLYVIRKMKRYAASYKQASNLFHQQTLISEFEAQPWGNGQSWFQQINDSPTLVIQTAKEFKMSYQNYLAEIPPTVITFWGAEFWLIAQAMRHPEMLKAVEHLANS